jgi:hypothetical protein
MRELVFVCAAAFAVGQDATVRLATEGGRTTFRIGEPIQVELTFQAQTKDRVDDWATERFAPKLEFDVFHVEPADGALDPLADWPASVAIHQWDDGWHDVLRYPPATITIPLNHFVSFRKPGHYKLSVETSRLEKHPSLRSNRIEIDIVTPEASWVEARFAEAQKDIYSEHYTASYRALEALRALETAEAARELARFRLATRYPTPNAALRSSPYKREALSVFDDAISEPDGIVGLDQLTLAVELAAAERGGNQEQVEREYFAKLGDAISRKVGRARAMALETLSHGPQAGESVRKSLVESFESLPEANQAMLLERDWARIASPEIVPLLRRLADGSGKLRDSALRRLAELDRAAARAIVLERIRRGDAGRWSLRAMLDLPEATLPEMDQPLLQALDRGDRVEDLIARYSTSIILPQLKAQVEQNPKSFCSTPLIAYFFRVDEGWAEAMLERVRKANGDSCFNDLSHLEDLLMSPGLERQAIRDLANPRWSMQAMVLLSYAGSDAALQPARDAFTRAGGGDQHFLTELLVAQAWLATPELISWAAANCSTDVCREMARGWKRSIEEPPAIHWAIEAEYTYAQIGIAILRSRKQFEAKVAQYPKGTAFVLPKDASATWYDRERGREVREILESAGMRVAP